MPATPRRGRRIITDAIYVSLKGISVTNQSYPTPFVGIVDVAISIWDTLANVRQNKTEFRKLAQVAGELVSQIFSTVESQRNASGVQISDQLRSNVSNLLSTLEAIRRLILEEAGRSFIDRLLKSNDQLVRISEYRDQLERSKRDFSLFANIAIQATVERVEMRQQYHQSQLMGALYGSAPNRSRGAAQSRAHINVGKIHNVNNGGTFNNIVTAY